MRFDIAPCPTGDVLALERDLGVSSALGQVLVRRGLGDPAAARAWLAADERHDASGFAGIDEAVGVILRHVRDRSRITVHGDYDVDGVCSTAILVGALRRLGADVDWYIPGRAQDGYGLSAATVERLADRGTRLIVTADCAITAVEEVAAARAAGIDVVVTDHHAPRADGALPAAPIVHPGIGGYPCPDLCATAVVHKLVSALDTTAGDAHDLDLVALATIADCVPLTGENRRLVREGLEALRATTRPGLRALMKVSDAHPGALDERTVGFRLAPRINAAGRMERADAALELLLTEDPARAERIADELDRLNVERRHAETRITFEAEAQVAEHGDRPAYVLAGEGWHPGVIGIVASRIAERHHRPTVLVALDGATGTGSGRSIPAFDLLAGLEAAAPHLLRHGGHRAAAGCTVARESLDAFRAAFVAHAESVLTAEDLVPTERVDAVVSGDELGAALAEELAGLAPFGAGNPGVSLLVPAARLSEGRTMGEGKHIRFVVESGGVRCRAVAFGTSRLPDGAEDALDASFTLELNEWGGAVEPRLVLRSAAPPAPGAIRVVGEPGSFRTAVLAELDAPLDPVAAPPRAAPRDRRGRGIAGTIAALVASGEPVLVACADTARRLRHLEGRLGGFHLCSYDAFARDPELASRYAHVVALDPAPHAQLQGWTSLLAWGDPELRFARDVFAELHALRPPLEAVYRALREQPGDLEAALRGDGRSAALAGRVLRILTELGLVEFDRDAFTIRVPAPRQTDLQASAAYRAYESRRIDGERWLRMSTPAAA